MRIWRISSATRWRRRWRQCCRTPGPGARQGKGWRRAAKPRLRPTRFPACRRPRRCALDRRGCPGTLCRAAGSARRRAGVRAGAGLAGDVRAGGGHDRAPGEAGAPPCRARRTALRGCAAAGGARSRERVPAAKVLAKHQEPAGRWRVGAGECGRTQGAAQRRGNHHAAQFRHPAARGGGDRAGQGVAPSAAGHAHRHAGLGRCRCSAGPLRGGQGEWRAVPGGSDPGLAARAARTARARGRGHRRRVAADHRHLADRVAQPWVGNLEGRWLSAMGVVAPRDPRSPWKRLRPRSRR